MAQDSRDSQNKKLALVQDDYKVGHGARDKGETPEERFAVLQDMTKSYLKPEEEDMLARAFEFASKVHAGQKRKSGEPSWLTRLKWR